MVVNHYDLMGFDIRIVTLVNIFFRRVFRAPAPYNLGALITLKLNNEVMLQKMWFPWGHCHATGGGAGGLLSGAKYVELKHRVIELHDFIEPSGTILIFPSWHQREWTNQAFFHGFAQTIMQLFRFEAIYGVGYIWSGKPSFFWLT